MRKLQVSDVTVHRVAKPDPDNSWEVIRGSFATDEVADEEYARELFNRVQSGEWWAWCGVGVVVSYEGEEGSAYVWGCDLPPKDWERDRDELIETHGLVQEALEELQYKIEEVLAKADRIRDQLSS